MRVFDMYSFNVASIVKFKDTKDYIEKMLYELGLSYEELGFELSIENPEQLTKLLDKYPDFNKYLDKPHEKIKTRVVSSFSENWSEGEVYARKEDREDIMELFTKIPRPFNFSYSRLIFDGIDWYGGGNLKPATRSRSNFDSLVWPFWLPFANSRIMIHRHDTDGNKCNMVHVIVEATTDGEPRDTTDILERLIPYLGNDYFSQRKCMFSHEEDDRFLELKRKYNYRLRDLFDSRIMQTDKNVPSEPKIPNIADKKTIQKAFKGTYFKFTDRKGLEPGMNMLKYKDAHNYEYTIMFDKLFWLNNFSFSLRIKGHNFEIEIPGGRHFGITEEGQSEKILTSIAEYCVFVCEEVSKELAADFGDTPGWFWDKE